MRNITLENLVDRKLQKIEWHCTGSLWSIQITMSDGAISQHIGSRNKLDQVYEFAEDDFIQEIRMLNSPGNKYCQGLKIIGVRGTSPTQVTFVECEGFDEHTQWSVHKLEKNEQIVGIYGSCNGANNMRGLGFMLWKPIEHIK